MQPEPKLYIVVREDLSRPQRWVQAAHAALEANLKGLVGEHPAFVILSVKNLKRLNWHMEKAPGKIAPFYDSFYDQITAFATMERCSTFDDLKLLR